MFESNADLSEHFFTFTRLVGAGIGGDGFTYRVEHVLDKCHQRHKFNKSAFWNIISTEIFAKVIRWVLCGGSRDKWNKMQSQTQWKSVSSMEKVELLLIIRCGLKYANGSGCLLFILFGWACLREQVNAIRGCGDLLFTILWFPSHCPNLHALPLRFIPPPSIHYLHYW